MPASLGFDFLAFRYLPCQKGKSSCCSFINLRCPSLKSSAISPFILRKFLYKYNDSKHFTRIKQHVNFYENSYLDKEFKKFLSFIEQHANLDKVPGTRNVHSYLLVFIHNTRKYMVNIYESFDNNLLKDFNASIYKSLAFHIGAVFSNCYTYNPDNPEMIKLYDEFFDKDVQKVRV